MEIVTTLLKLLFSRVDKIDPVYKIDISLEEKISCGNEILKFTQS